MDRPIPALDGVEHRFLDAGGLRMHIAEAGDPEAEPVVLLHGWPQHWYAWRKLIGPLAEHYRVICPDMRGFGWTDAPEGSYLKSELAEDIIALFDVLELDRVRLAGHDWGGFAGFLICIKAPERVSHYVAAGITHPWVRGDGGIGERLALLARIWYMLLIASPVAGGQVVRRVPAFVRNVHRKGAVREDTWTDEELEEFVAQWSEPDRAAACVQVYRSFLTKELAAIARGDYRDQTMDIPAILFVGDGDPVIQSEGLAGFERNAPGMRIETIEGVGHWVPEEAPEVMLPAMIELFAR